MTYIFPARRAGFDANFTADVKWHTACFARPVQARLLVVLRAHALHVCIFTKGCANQRSLCGAWTSLFVTFPETCAGQVTNNRQGSHARVQSAERNGTARHTASKP